MKLFTPDFYLRLASVCLSHLDSLSNQMSNLSLQESICIHSVSRNLVKTLVRVLVVEMSSC